jgi:hypothetical protein
MNSKWHQKHYDHSTKGTLSRSGYKANEAQNVVAAFQNERMNNDLRVASDFIAGISSLGD